MAVVSGKHSAFEYAECRSDTGVPGDYGSVLSGVRDHTGSAPREGWFGGCECLAHAHSCRSHTDEAGCCSCEPDEGETDKHADGGPAAGNSVANAYQGAGRSDRASLANGHTSVDAECDRHTGATDGLAYLGGDGYANSNDSSHSHPDASPDAHASADGHCYPHERVGHAHPVGDAWTVSLASGDDGQSMPPIWWRPERDLTWNL